MGLIDFALKTDLQRNSPMGSLLTKPQNAVFQWVHYILERIQWQSDPLRPFQVITANDQTQSQRQLRVCSFGTHSEYDRDSEMEQMRMCPVVTLHTHCDGECLVPDNREWEKWMVPIRFTNGIYCRDLKHSAISIDGNSYGTIWSDME